MAGEESPKPAPKRAKKAPADKPKKPAGEKAKKAPGEKAKKGDGPAAKRQKTSAAKQQQGTGSLPYTLYVSCMQPIQLGKASEPVTACLLLLAVAVEAPPPPQEVVNMEGQLVRDCESVQVGGFAEHLQNRSWPHCNQC
jgi:hypothetical protein